MCSAVKRNSHNISYNNKKSTADGGRSAERGQKKEEPTKSTHSVSTLCKLPPKKWLLWSLVCNSYKKNNTKKKSFY